jgi:uncharacterized phage-associated protein
MDVDEVLVYQYFGENYTAVREQDLSLFESSELKILAEVKEHFKEFSATQFRDFSRQEQGYLETTNRLLISFLFATNLQI